MRDKVRSSRGCDVVNVLKTVVEQTPYARELSEEVHTS
jgi:hypothetical protein